MSTTTIAPPAREPLTRGRIVDAALTIARADGMAALSMRRLADELGVSTMAAYRHVSGKEELVLAVVSHVLDEVMAIAPNATGSWKRWIRLLADRSYERIAAVPGLAGELSRPAALDLSGLVWVDAFHAQALRRRPGFRDAQRSTGEQAARARAFAQSLVWLICAAAVGFAGDDPDALSTGVDLLIAGYDG